VGMPGILSCGGHFRAWKYEDRRDKHHVEGMTRVQEKPVKRNLPFRLD